MTSISTIEKLSKRRAVELNVDSDLAARRPFKDVLRAAFAGGMSIEVGALKLFVMPFAMGQTTGGGIGMRFHIADHPLKDVPLTDLSTPSRRVHKAKPNTHSVGQKEISYSFTPARPLKQSLYQFADYAFRRFVAMSIPTPDEGGRTIADIDVAEVTQAFEDAAATC